MTNSELQDVLSGRPAPKKEPIVKEKKSNFLTWWPSIFLYLLTIYVTFVILDIIDHDCFASKYHNKLRYKKDCSFVVPAGYKLVYSEAKKEYAIKVESGEDSYLYTTSRGNVMSMYSSIKPPSAFDDSCTAKAFLSAYLESIKPALTTFK